MNSDIYFRFSLNYRIKGLTSLSTLVTKISEARELCASSSPLDVCWAKSLANLTSAIIGKLNTSQNYMLPRADRPQGAIQIYRQSKVWGPRGASHHLRRGQERHEADRNHCEVNDSPQIFTSKRHIWNYNIPRTCCRKPEPANACGSILESANKIKGSL